MKRVFILTSVLIYCAVLLSSCVSSLPVNQHIALTVLKAYVPTFPVDDSRSERDKIIEEDDYGRVMLAYSSSYDIFYPANTVAIAIMQKYDKDNIYYDDLFYIISSDFTVDFVDVSSPEIVSLKDQNDWNKPLDEEKMSSRKISLASDNTVVREDHEESNKEFEMFWDEVDEYIRKHFEYVGKKVEFMLFYDFDRKSKELYLAVDEISEGEYECYLVLRDVHGGFNVMKIVDLYNYQKDLADFKKANGWNY